MGGLLPYMPGSVGGLGGEIFGLRFPPVLSEVGFGNSKGMGGLTGVLSPVSLSGSFGRTGVVVSIGDEMSGAGSYTIDRDGFSLSTSSSIKIFILDS